MKPQDVYSHLYKERESEENQFRQSRLQKLTHIVDAGNAPFPSSFKRTHPLTQIHGDYAHLKDGEETQDRVVIAGRIRAYRNSGMFMDIHDTATKLQIFTHKDYCDPEVVDLVKNLDIGDIIGIEGYIRRTPRGEITVNAQKVTLLTKALLPLPEKYHGLSDVEARYRQRYLDLIMSDDTRTRLRLRSRITQAVREYLVGQEFLEVETPMLHPIAGGAIAKPFVTHHNALDMDLFLRIAPELYLKKLIVGGLSERVFELNRCFRNEGISTRHNPEFTQVELYQAYGDVEDMMAITEGLVEHVANTVLGGSELPFGETTLNFKGPWKRASMCDLVKEHGSIDLMDCPDAQSAQDLAKKVGVSTKKQMSWGHVVEAAFEHFVEPNLKQPTLVTHLPTDISPLAKVCPDDHRLTERFEAFVNGWEIANGFSELNDAIDQRLRFETQVSARDSGDDEAHAMDADFICALEYGLPPTGGLGIGIDRLTMLLTNTPNIRDVIAFPTLKPKI